MLKVGRKNVSAKEIEDLCRQVPGVRRSVALDRVDPTRLSTRSLFAFVDQKP